MEEYAGTAAEKVRDEIPAPAVDRDSGQEQLQNGLQAVSILFQHRRGYLEQAILRYHELLLRRHGHFPRVDHVLRSISRDRLDIVPGAGI